MGMLPPASPQDVGIDPGVKTALKTSDGEKFERENLSRTYCEEQVAKAQRHCKKDLFKKHQAKIKARRQDLSHKASYSLAKSQQTLLKLMFSIKNPIQSFQGEAAILTVKNQCGGAIWKVQINSFKII
jgi:hypothetical protein